MISNLINKKMRPTQTSFSKNNQIDASWSKAGDSTRILRITGQTSCYRSNRVYCQKPGAFTQRNDFFVSNRDNNINDLDNKILEGSVRENNTMPNIIVSRNINDDEENEYCEAKSNPFLLHSDDSDDDEKNFIFTDGACETEIKIQKNHYQNNVINNNHFADNDFDNNNSKKASNQTQQKHQRNVNDTIDVINDNFNFATNNNKNYNQNVQPNFTGKTNMKKLKSEGELHNTNNVSFLLNANTQQIINDAPNISVSKSQNTQFLLHNHVKSSQSGILHHQAFENQIDESDISKKRSNHQQKCLVIPQKLLEIVHHPPNSVVYQALQGCRLYLRDEREMLTISSYLKAYYTQCKELSLIDEAQFVKARISQLSQSLPCEMTGKSANSELQLRIYKEKRKQIMDKCSMDLFELKNSNRGKSTESEEISIKNFYQQQLINIAIEYNQPEVGINGERLQKNDKLRNNNFATTNPVIFRKNVSGVKSGGDSAAQLVLRRKYPLTGVAAKSKQLC
ncbi:hypothetical protein TRFO_37392 [Tritrichomonas foetus]|uniref:Uncharacterized protein n=1 Tax=Tritrichomonas foetus TaxID=1144522 RepID=A0A1J4JB72_9EUKA|nr:hypothetical protein TRFO_37392 [Tritrichomonas foetus]|eukprot:OHS96442.1 hypothetical protein TRFO_37392 [Tritrichomonas foetus]